MASAFGVDTLGALTEKLKTLINETQGNYESFIEYNQLYKQGRLNEKEFFAKIGDYMIATSALSFLAIRVIFELKTALDKNTKGGSSSKNIQSSYSPSPDSFGISGFVGGSSSNNPAMVNTGGGISSGGFVGPSSYPSSSYSSPDQQTHMQQQSQEAVLKPAVTDINKNYPQSNTNNNDNSNSKNCISCGISLPKSAKFCNRCGQSQ